MNIFLLFILLELTFIKKINQRKAIIQMVSAFCTFMKLPGKQKIK